MGGAVVGGWRGGRGSSCRVKFFPLPRPPFCPSVVILLISVWVLRPRNSFFISCTAVVEVVSFSAWTSRCHRFWGCWCMWGLSLSRARSSTLNHLRIKVSISVELKVLASGLTEITPPPSKCSRSIVRNTISFSLSPLSRMVTLSPIFDTCRGGYTRFRENELVEFVFS